MAKISGIRLFSENPKINHGVAFTLNKKCMQDWSLHLEDLCEFEVKDQSEYAVVRFQGSHQETKNVQKSYELAQKCLDIFSVTENRHFLIHRNLNQYYFWQKRKSKTSLELTVLEPISIEFALNMIQESPFMVSEHQYHESFRYFRNSKNSEDLFDAFRNMYLAFESILGYRVSIQIGESESEWLKRAFSKANLGSIYTYGENRSSNFYKNIYKKIRCQTFHAKDGQDKILPYDLKYREKVSQALVTLTRIVLMLIENDDINDTNSQENQVLNLRLRGGGGRSLEAIIMETKTIQEDLEGGTFFISGNSNILKMDWDSLNTSKNKSHFLSKVIETTPNQAQNLFEIHLIMNKSEIKTLGSKVSAFKGFNNSNVAYFESEIPVIDLSGLDEFKISLITGSTISKDLKSYTFFSSL